MTSPVLVNRDKHLAISGNQKKLPSKQMRADVVKVGTIFIKLSSADRWRFLLLCK